MNIPSPEKLDAGGVSRKMFRHPPFGPVWLWWVMLSLFIVRLGFVIWSLNKGIDITDECWYLVAYRFPSPHLYPIHQYQRVISGWLPFAMDDLVTARIFRVVTDLSSIFFVSVAFSRMVARLIQPSRKVHWMYPFLMLSQVFSISLFSRAFGYTDFSLMNLSFVFSFLIVGLSSAKQVVQAGSADFSFSSNTLPPWWWEASCCCCCSFLHSGES
jgi:hypothetical protein